MPITKTAKRALRSSANKAKTNNKIVTNLEIAIRIAKKSKGEVDIKKAISLADRAAKKKVIHKNKAAHVKSSLSKLLPRSAAKTKISSKRRSSPTSGKKSPKKK
jgi:small subunit ribosomal protein S20